MSLEPKFADTACGKCGKDVAGFYTVGGYHWPDCPPEPDSTGDSSTGEPDLVDRRRRFDSGTPESPLQPCGHPMSAIASSDEGTSYCCDCEANGGTSHPNTHDEPNTASADGYTACNKDVTKLCDCETVALVVTERDALKAALREARDFVIAIDHASVNRFEPRRVEMVQSIDTILGETPK